MKILLGRDNHFILKLLEYIAIDSDTAASKLANYKGASQPLKNAELTIVY